MLIKTRDLNNQTFICIFLFFIIVLASNKTIAQSGNSKASQWENRGGELLLSGKQEFNESWTSSADSREKGLYWQGSLYDPEEDRNYQPWEDVVKNSVSPVVGEITVVGPGTVGLFVRSKGGKISMVDKETKQNFTPWSSSISWFRDSWSGTVKDYPATGFPFWGQVGAQQEITLVVSAVMDSYNNMINTGEYAFRAPQEVEYEVWFFPRDGGKVISINSLIPGMDKPQPGILYYEIKKCN